VNDISPLLESAHEFPEEALRNFSAGRFNFAIVHAVTAAELVLKERLARVNPALVLKNIDAKTPQTEQTVSLGALPRRFANLGMPLTEAKLILDVAKWRHEIVHHMPTFDRSIAKRQLSLLLDFIAMFLRNELNTPLETFLSKSLYRDASRLLADWQTGAHIARSAAAKEGNVLTDSCPRCGASDVMSLRVDAAVYCHLCGAGLYQCENCDSCGRKKVRSYKPTKDDENICGECIDAAAEDYYVSMQLDLARGK
jgi:hypothetical protein